MICADTSTWIAWFQGEQARDVELLEDSLRDQTAVLSPVVIAELFSNPRFTDFERRIIGRLPVLEIEAGFWQRAGLTRAALVRRRCRPKLADTLIAQSCMDANVPLIARDRDYLPFSRHSGLSLIWA